MKPETTVVQPEAHHYLGIEMNQQVWHLLGQESRDDKDNDRMEHFALASLYHWERSPKFAPINGQRGYWLLARVCSVLGRGDKAIVHAERCLALTLELDLKDFDLAYAYEAMARAYASAGIAQTADQHYQMARKAGEAIAKDEDKKLVMSDLEE
jgi:tetratricopeptide (TPR) repeat protein